MRVAVISDVHGNRFALDKALADMEGRSIDATVCLGDTLQGGPQPKETAEKLREMKIPIVMGNSDAWLLDQEADTLEPTSQAQRDVRKWTLSKLSDEDLAFVRTYRPTVEVDLGGQRLLCFHGSPRSYDELLRPDTPQGKWDEVLGPHAPAVMAGGHTHTQQVRRIGEGLFFNPGSIGVVFNVLAPQEKFRLYPWAEYAILSHEHGLSSVEFRRAAYDVNDYIRVVKTSGRPHAETVVGDYTRQ